jgi:transposase
VDEHRAANPERPVEV